MENSYTVPPESSRVLIVDDDMFNRELLADFLGTKGFIAQTCATGEAAIDLVTGYVPDVILLDLMMPGMNGFDVCRRLKSDRAMKHIPVLIVTALHSRQDRLEGIEAGADDFVTKPYDFEELLYRVRNAATMHRLYTQLHNSYEKLESLEQFRNTLTQMIVHDLRSPLTGSIALIGILQNQMRDLLDERQQKVLNRVRYSNRVVVEMLNSILDIGRLEESGLKVNKAPTDLVSLVRSANEILGLPEQDVQIRLAAPDHPVWAECDEVMISRVVLNLLDNALKHSPPGTEIEVLIRSEEAHVHVEVADNGRGVPESILPVVFDKYVSLTEERVGARYSAGLGLAFCKAAVTAHGGDIGVQSEENKGSVFWFRLPIGDPAALAA